MAIQNRRGIYTNFDPSKMVEGELAVVLSGDPGSSTGRSLYVCFGPGIVKRIADYEDAADMIDAATEDVQASFLAAVNQAISDADTATDTATSAAQTAQTAAQTAIDAADTADTAAQEARSYVLGDISNKTVTFTEAANRETIQSTESTATLFGKIKKWFSDIRDAAFHTVANNLTTNTSGYVLDARQGQALNALIQSLQSYKAGETIDIKRGIFAGYLANSRKNVYFYIPLQKPIASGVTVDFTHFITVMRHSDGGYIKTGTAEALSNYGTINYWTSDTGIYVSVVLNTVSEYTNQGVVVAYADANSYLTLS